MGYTFEIYQEFACLKFRCNEHVKNPWENQFPHYAILHRVLNMVKDRGFCIKRDPEKEERCKCISKNYWYGKKGDLEFKVHRYPTGFEIEFYQNVIFENKSGGFYDFDKYKKMPYMIKLLFRNEVKYIKEFLKKLGCVDNSKPIYKYATEKVKYCLVDSMHHPQKSMSEFELSDLNGQTCEESYNHTDRDKKVIYNGQTKYFRHWNGRLMRGKVYHNINNMWWVILNAYEYRNIADFELFDPTPEDYQLKRKKRGEKPKEYLLKQEQIAIAKTKELITELRRRGVKMVS